MSDREAITAGEALLAAMKSAGIDVLLANPGTDFPPLIEALADPARAADLPRALAVHHETVAMGMAHGHWLVSGRMAAVAVHVNVGLANCAMGVLNARASQVPVLLLSGRTPITETGREGSRISPIHWGQEMYDQAGMIREAVKWDYELRFPEQAGEAVRRAVSIAGSAPSGPVYLSLPREVLAGTAPAELSRTAKPANAPPPDPAMVLAAADILAAAERPVIVLQRAAPPGALDRISELVEATAIPVVEFWPTANALPNTHPMHAGFDPTEPVRDADAVLAIGAAVPWVPSAIGPIAPRLVALGPDPLELATPWRGFAAEVVLQGDAAAGIAALTKALSGRLSSTALESRRAAQKARRHAQREAVERQIGAGERGPMNHAYVSHVLSDVLTRETTLFSELGAVAPALRLDHPGQFHSMPHAGGLGFGLPAALGAKLAAPSRRVIATVGDGSYLFANPAACHQVAAQHGLAVLTVVFNNGRWEAVRRATAGMYPDGSAATSNAMPLTELGPSPDYAGLARAFGAHAEAVADPADLAPALSRALHAVEVKGQQALLDVRVA